MELSDKQKQIILNKSKEWAKDFDPEEVEEKLEKEEKRAENKRIFSEIRLMLQMIMDPDYEVDPLFYAAAAGALAYFAMPLDLLPDFIPIVGYIDDFFVVSYVLKKFSEEIEKYREYCEERKCISSAKNTQKD